MTGGYSLIDFFDVNITSEPVKIEGIFKKYQTSKRKAFLLSNVTINNTQLNDVFSTPYFEDGKVCFPAYDGVIKISDTDYVTFESTADVIADKYLSKEDFLTIESDHTPYVSRTARDGLVKIPQLVGGTVAWNQLIQNGNFASADGWLGGNTNVTVSDNVATVSKLQAATSWANIYRNVNCNVNHVYIAFAEFNPDANNYSVVICNPSSPIESGYTANEWNNGCIVFKNYSGVYRFGILNANTSIGSTIQFRNVHIHDLTQMFGTTIADYVYSLEQATEGSGLAWLKSYGFFTKDYYAYDAGSLQSVCTSGRKITSLDGSERTYPIENEELRGLFKLDANNKLYCDGDVYKSSGAVTRKFGIVDLGTLDWSRETVTSGAGYRFKAVVDNLKPNEVVSTLSNLVTAKYIAIASQDTYYGVTGIAVKSNGQLTIYDEAYKDSTSSTFKTAMDGVYLVYELATETTFSADPYINPQRSEGTEEFVDGLTRDVMIPVGNNSTYYKDELFNIIGEYIDSCDDAVIAMIPEGE